MTITARVLVQGKAVEDAQTTQYVASNVTALITKFTLTNYSANVATVTVNIVATGGTPGDINQVLRAKALQPGETYQCPELVNQVLQPGNFISTLASTPGAVGMRVSGREIS